MAYSIKQNDLLPTLKATLWTDSTKTVALSLVGVTTVSAVFRKPDATILKRTCTVLDAANGRVEFVWQSGDTNVPGEWELEFELIISTKPQTVPTRKSDNPKFSVDTDLG